MFKKYIKSALLGVSMLAIGGMANAATYEINMFGATAEFNYWVQSDVGFLTGLGCRAADVHYARNTASSGAGRAAASRSATAPRPIMPHGLPATASTPPKTPLSFVTRPVHHTTASRLFRARTPSGPQVAPWAAQSRMPAGV